MELRDYQKVQNDAVRQSMRKGNKRVISTCPTGSGKSIMIGDLAKSTLEKGNKVNIILPRRSLVSQLSQSFSDWNINHGVVMAGEPMIRHLGCQIMSIDTYIARVNSGRMAIIPADCLIVDEMHLQYSKKKIALFENYKYVVGFSATPVAPKGSGLGHFYSDIVETVTMSELMDMGYLTKLKYYADPSIDLSSLKISNDGDYMDSQLGEVMDKPKLVGDILKNWIRIAENKSTVIFASSQSHARHLCDEFNSYGYIAEYVDCNTPDEDRQALFSRVKSGETKVIVNVGIVSVGIDIPNLEVVVLARPTRLISVYLQCVGRVTRLSEGKTHGIVIDHAGIIKKLGFATDIIEWTLDGKESTEDRKEKAQKENKEPKDIICDGCGYVFRSARRCPECLHEMVKKGEALPVHEMDLKEITVIKPKPSDKKQFYAEVLGYFRSQGKPDSYALALFRGKYDEWPHKKRSIIPVSPSQDTISYILQQQKSYVRKAK